MAKRPQFKIKIFGLLIEYWGPPSRRLNMAVSDTSQARKLTEIVFGILLLKAAHDLVSDMVSSFEPPNEAWFALTRAVLAIALAVYLFVKRA